MTDIKRIYQLPSHLANQIAAGEVIERPASVLKEILENSLDAGATQIDIKIERGGIGLIQVQDNGCGICKEDLALALASHATSKIASLSDLENILSYGFRGEALASIGSVSRLQLSSWVADQEFGWCIYREGRDMLPTLKPVPKRPGVIVEVRDLFYNTPARRKFLRSEKTETAYVEEIFKRIALSQPAVAFKFQAGERLQKRLPVCQDAAAQARRVAILCGESFIRDAYYIQAESNGLLLTGWLGAPHSMRSQADLQYFYVNGRIVRDKVVMHAVRQAYQAAAQPGRYPAYVLYFELDPAGVDVNVHPTKHEVRFRETRTIHAFLIYAIQEGLKQGDEKQGRDTITMLKMDLADLATKEESTSAMINAPLAHKQTVIKPLFLLEGELLLAENEQGLAVLDVKGVQQSYLREQLMSAYKEEGVSKKLLLMPQSMSLKHGMDRVESMAIDLDRLGFEITAMGHALILIRTVPVFFGMKAEGLEELIVQLLALSDVEQYSHCIAEHIVKYQNWSEKDIDTWLSDLKKTDFFIKKTEMSKYYKQVTVEGLRGLFI